MREEILDNFRDNPEEVLDFLNIEYKVKGPRIEVLCPFHNDHSLGSAHIRNGYFHCFACGESADVFTLYEQVKGCGFRQAYTELSAFYGLTPGIYSPENNTFYLSSEEKNALAFPKQAPLNYLRKSDPEAYKSIIKARTDEMLAKYNKILNKFGSRDAELAYKIIDLGSQNILADIEKIKSECNTKIRVLKALRERM